VDVVPVDYGRLLNTRLGSVSTTGTHTGAEQQEDPESA